MTDIAYLTAQQLAELYAKRELSPVEVTRALLSRIERVEPFLNAFVLVDADRALSAAHASEERWKRGEALSPLDGVPISIKDLLLTRGWPTRFGSRTTPDSGRWEEDAPAVARLREAGAVLFGKTTTSEFGLKGMGDSPLSGFTRNPWNRAHTPGGSSAGAVASIAAGVGAIAIGTDGGGSIRVPSAHTGVIGIKPTFGLVPTSPPAFIGVPPHIGPIARSVADLALALRVLSQPDARDPAQPTRSFQLQAPQPSLRIAYSVSLGYIDVDPEIASAFGEAIAALRDAGLQLEEAEPGIRSSGSILSRLFAARAAFTVRELDSAQRTRLDPAITAAAEQGERQSALDYLQAESERVEIIAALARFHTRFDLLLTPTSAYPAPLVDAAARKGESFAAPFSLTRQPGLSIPNGRTAEGLPIGLQIIGRHFEDANVLALAQRYESIRPFQRPQLAADKPAALPPGR